MSSSANLTAIITKTNLYDNIKEMIITLLPVFIVSLLFYYFLGEKYAVTYDTTDSINNIKSLLLSNFNISYVLLLPPAIVLGMSLFKINIRYNLVAGIVTAAFISSTYQNSNILEILKALILGFHPINTDLVKLISGGGLVAMKGILLIVGSATFFYGILQGTNMITPLTERFIKGISNIDSLIIRTVILGLLANIITLNQTLAVIIPGKSMAKAYDSFGVSRNILARTISDSSIVLAPLVPWNINGLVISVALGVSVLKYIPFSVLCYLLPVSTLIINKIVFKRKAALDIS